MRNIVLPVFLGIFILSTPIQAHYLSSADLVDGVTLLPPPPAKGTNNFKRDIEAYKHGKTIRDTKLKSVLDLHFFTNLINHFLHILTA